MPAQSPARVRVLNRLGDWLQRFGVHVLPFEPDRLRKIAIRRSGLHDFAEEPLLREGLEVLCRSIEQDASLTLVGRFAIRAYVVRALTNRLRYVQARACEPEVADIELIAPIIVIGLPRSGTTLLHHLLSLHPRARSLLFWELIEPIPGPGPDRRREELQRMVADMKRMTGSIDSKHHLDADNPEECMLLLDSTFVSLAFWVFAPVHEYARWLRQQDQRVPYSAYRWYLQRFQRDNPGRRLVLKAPAHTAALEALLQAIPNAQLVQIHRDPAAVVPSLNSLLSSFHSMVAEPIDIERMAENNMAQLEHMIAAAERAHAAGHSWVEVEYTDLVGDPVACLRDIHTRLGLAFDDQMVSRIETFMAARPSHKFGNHVYCAEDFGSSQLALRERFAGYYEQHIIGHHQD